MDLVSYITTTCDFIIIPLLVYLSLAKVKDGLFKYFTLNIMAICSVATISDAMVDVISVVNLFTDVHESLLAFYLLSKQFTSPLE